MASNLIHENYNAKHIREECLTVNKTRVFRKGWCCVYWIWEIFFMVNVLLSWITW